MKKILVYVHNLKHGVGLSEWVLKYYNALCQEPNVEISLFVETDVSDTDKNNALVDLSKQINIINGEKLKKNYLKYINFWLHDTKEFEIIHFQVDNLVRFLPIFLLKSSSKKVFIHSHSSKNLYVVNNKFKLLLHNIGKRIVHSYSFNRVSCSDLAANWLYNNDSYKQINNGIDTKAFRFNMFKRLKFRKELGLSDDTIAFIHVGRFAEQKNHKRLISIYSNIVKTCPNSRLYLVGDGVLKKDIEKLIKENNLKDNVIFLGMRTDIDSLLNAFDATIFPSIFEGFPISLVETQANGLPTFFSSAITLDIKISDVAFQFNLNESDSLIADFILKKISIIDPQKRETIVNQVVEHGYDSSHTLKQLKQLYGL